MKIDTPISCGELVDKLTILQIKKLKINDKNKLEQINKEYEYLMKRYSKLLKKFPNLNEMYDQLNQINLKLWEIEDKIRICEKNKKFDERFIDLARNVYRTNDLRFKIKNEINEYLNSDIKEQKSYEQY
tara:strand:+ start:77 stop:463 length:387 start_codon:yes stop_codon:yes gene_type:complete